MSDFLFLIGYMSDLLRVRKEKGLDSKDYDLTPVSFLLDLYKLVGKPVIERLRELKVPEKSRVWWCQTSVFCSFLHATSPIPSGDGKELYFSDSFIPSYTPSPSALIGSRKRGSLSENLKPSILLVAHLIPCLGRSAKSQSAFVGSLSLRASLYSISLYFRKGDKYLERRREEKETHGFQICSLRLTVLQLLLG